MPWGRRTKSELPVYSVSVDLEAEDLSGALGAERVLARPQAFLHFQAIESVGVQMGEFDADGFGLLLRRKNNLAAAVSRFQLVERQLGGHQLVELRSEEHTSELQSRQYL